jgi:hypothetical protein
MIFRFIPRVRKSSSRTARILPTHITRKIAEEVAERLNAEEDRREEDRWA